MCTQAHWAFPLSVIRVLAWSICTQPCTHRHTRLCLFPRLDLSAHTGACWSSLPDSSAWFRTLRHRKKAAPSAPPSCACPAKAPIATLWGTSSFPFPTSPFPTTRERNLSRYSFSLFFFKKPICICLAPYLNINSKNGLGTKSCFDTVKIITQ